MAINLNAEPYNDDFSESKNFYQILFRPGFSVQARELTQLQSILRDQIAKFGNHIFKHGSIVIPGNSIADLGVPYVKVETQYSGVNLSLADFIDKTVVGATSGVEAIVKKTVVATETDPTTFYLSYTSGNPDTGAVKFVDGEEIYVKDSTGTRATALASASTGTGTLAYINKGVYYVNGTFVYVEPQSAVISKYDSTPSCHVLLKINESVVDYSQDESLLDNAQGSYNYAAPGADRLKIWLELTSLPIDTAVTNDYIEIMRYRDGVLEEHAKTAKYSELEKSLARRTFDESGNYVVEGLSPTLREYLKRDTNGGVYAPAADATDQQVQAMADQFVVEVNPGKAYISGFEVEKIANTRIPVAKARTEAHIKDTDVALRPEFGQYMVVSDMTGAFNINSSGSSDGGTIVDFYDTVADVTALNNWAAYTNLTVNSFIENAGYIYRVDTGGYTGDAAPGFQGTQTNSTLWTAGATIATNASMYIGSRLYKATTGGVTGNAAPTHTSGSAVNATYEWTDEKLLAVNETVYSGGNLYSCTVAGLTGHLAPNHTTGSVVNSVAYSSGLSVALDTTIYVSDQFGRRLYKVTTGGNLGITAPAHKSGSKTSGTAVLLYIGEPATLTYVGAAVTFQYIGTAAVLTYSGASGTKLGTARVVGIDYLAGDPEKNPIYRLWLTDIAMSSYSTVLEDVGSLRYIGADGGTDSAYALTVFNAPLTTGSFDDGDPDTSTPGETIVHETSGRTAMVKYWDANSGLLYAYRHNASKKTPQKGDGIVGTRSKSASVVKAKNVVTSVGQQSLLFPLPKEIPATLLAQGESLYDVKYSVLKQLSITVDSSGNGDQSVTGGTIMPIEVGTFIAIGRYGVLSNDYFSINVEGSTVTAAGVPGGAQVVKVYCAVSKTATTRKTKTLTTSSTITYKYFALSTAYNSGDNVWYGNNMYVVTSGGTSDDTDYPTHTTGTVVNGTVSLKYVSNLSKITLPNTDISELVSVVDTLGDITGNYTFWNGQTDYAYKRGELRRVTGRPLPTGTFSVVYKYYAHSINGDFFSVDSYKDIANFLDRKIEFTSESSGKKYDLAQCLDFRPSVGEDGTFSGTGARLNDLPLSGSSLTTPMRYYVPRIDSLVVDSVGNISVISGAPAEKAVEPSIPNGQFELNRFYIPAYTRSVSNIEVKRMDVERFTMKDIKGIVNRVKNLEEFSTLTASEVAVTSYEITDAKTGLNRFKSGYLVENFKNPFTIARTTHGDYAASFVGEALAAPIEELICDLELINDPDADTTFVIKGGCLMLPYTEEVFAAQPLSSRVTNLNPFQVIRWDGILRCDPPADQWTEVLDLPTVFESQTETITYRWNSRVPTVSTVTTYRSPAVPVRAFVRPAPIQLIAYRVTQPDGHTYNTVGAPGAYDKISGVSAQVIGQTTINQSLNGAATTRAIDNAAKRLGGANAVVMKDVYKQVGFNTSTLSTDAMIGSTQPR